MSAQSNAVALVTGATRGIGRGTALALAEHGYIVYITGRTRQAGGHTLSGSLEETRAEVEARGGRCVAAAVDHADDAQIEALFEQIRTDEGRLDLLVNNVMAIPEAMTAGGPFWEKSLDVWAMMDVGLRSNFVAARLAAQLMVGQGGGLIVAMSGYVGVTYTYDVVFGTCKAATDRMARDMAVELKPHGVCSVSLWQGFTFTERALKNLETVQGMRAQLNSAAGSSAEFPGRVIRALAEDPDRMAYSGASLIVPELAQSYGLKDIDGREIPSLRESRGAPIWQPV